MYNFWSYFDICSFWHSSVHVCLRALLLRMFSSLLMARVKKSFILYIFGDVQGWLDGQKFAYFSTFNDFRIFWRNLTLSEDEVRCSYHPAVVKVWWVLKYFFLNLKYFPIFKNRKKTFICFPKILSEV